MANEGNLRVPSSSEARINGAKGGKASAKKKREKKAFKESFEAVLNMPLKNGKIANVETIKSYAALKGKNITVQEAIAIAMLQKALKGDVRAAEYIRDTIGQNPAFLFKQGEFANEEALNKLDGILEELKENAAK